MNSLYFAQYLVNEDVISGRDAKELLKEAEKTTPGLAVVALAEGAVSASTLAELMPFEKDAFSKLAVAEGLLFASQVEKLQEARSTDGLKTAQALLDSGRMDFMELGRWMAACGSTAESPFKESVRRIIEEQDEELAAERDIYADFTELFMRSLMRFMDTPAIVTECAPDGEEALFATHTVSQRLSGSVSFVSGLYASDKVFIEMAQRYSHELIDEADEMAADCVSEFLNVVNGLFMVDLGKRDYDLDLETPRVGKNTRLMGSRQLQLCVDTGFGSFTLVLASDEVTHSEAHHY